MFPAGTRVYVCSSSITGKKLGPKRHSLGYVSDSNTARHINSIKNFPFAEQSFLFVPLQIVFTKYGKEKRHRLETRSFFNIIPTFTNSNTNNKDKCPKRINEILEHFNKGELSKNQHWLDWLELVEDTIPPTIGVVIPMRSPTKMDIDESKAWVISILKNESFKRLVVKNRSLHMSSDPVLVWLANAVKHSSPRRDLLLWAEDDPKNMCALICHIRRLNATFDKRMLERSMRYMKRGLESGGGINTNNFINWYINHMLSDESILARKREIINPRNISSSLINLAVGVDRVRTAYLTLRPKYI